MTTILIILGIITLWLWILNQPNTIHPTHKSGINVGTFAIVTVWLLVEVIRRWV